MVLILLVKLNGHLSEEHRECKSRIDVVEVGEITCHFFRFPSCFLCEACNVVAHTHRDSTLYGCKNFVLS
nr:MAG TPA: hypothetical protein [Crassvirales sp.]